MPFLPYYDSPLHMDHTEGFILRTLAQRHRRGNIISYGGVCAKDRQMQSARMEANSVIMLSNSSARWVNQRWARWHVRRSIRTTLWRSMHWFFHARGERCDWAASAHSGMQGNILSGARTLTTGLALYANHRCICNIRHPASHLLWTAYVMQINAESHKEQTCSTVWFRNK